MQVKLCTLICPSRSEPQKLRRLLNSYFRTAISPENLDAVIRIDSDWTPITGQVRELVEEFPGARFITGHRLNGYHSVPEFLEECASISKAEWLWPMDDDYEIIGDGWDTQLSHRHDQAYTFSQPEHYLLHQSRYSHNGEGYGPQGMLLRRWFFPSVRLESGQNWDKAAFDIAQANYGILPLRCISLRHHWEESLSVKRRTEQLCTPPSP